MALKLKWKNPNKGETTIDIYRGDTSTVDLTTPMVSLSDGETEWVDSTALFGKTYYYVWAVNGAGDRGVSRPQRIEVNDRKGPGTNLLTHGNEDYGFFGTVPAADFINSSTLLAVAKAAGLPTNIVYPTWYKYSRRGKVLFVPNQSLGDTNWQTVYNAGFVYGTNDTGPNRAGEVNQLTTFELNGDLFLVRSPTAFPDNLTFNGLSASYDFDTMPEAKDTYAEYEDLLFPMIYNCPLRQRLVTVGNENSNGLLPPLYDSSSRNSVGIICKENNSANAYVAQRGGGYNSYSGVHTRATLRQCNRRNKTDTGVWWPVVEYIGRVGEVDLAKLGV